MSIFWIHLDLYIFVQNDRHNYSINNKIYCMKKLMNNSLMDEKYTSSQGYSNNFSIKSKFGKQCYIWIWFDECPCWILVVKHVDEDQL